MCTTERTLVQCWITFVRAHSTFWDVIYQVEEIPFFCLFTEIFFFIRNGAAFYQTCSVHIFRLHDTLFCFSMWWIALVDFHMLNLLCTNPTKSWVLTLWLLGKVLRSAPCGLHALFLLTLHAALSLALGLFPWPMGTRQYSAEYLGESLHVPRSFLCRSVLRARLTFLAGLWVPSLPQVRRVAWVRPSWVRAWRLSLGKQQGSCRTPLLSRGTAL